MEIWPIRKAFDENEVVEWPKWVCKKEEFVNRALNKQDEVKKVTKVVKELKTTKIYELIDVF